MDDGVESFVGEAALGGVAEPFSKQTDEMCDFERLEGDFDRQVILDQVGAESVTERPFNLKTLHQGVSQQLQILRKSQVLSVDMPLYKFL